LGVYATRFAYWSGVVHYFIVRVINGRSYTNYRYRDERVVNLVGQKN
jgi:hypothetical protein